MLFIMIISKKIYRDYNTLNALAVCGLIFLLINPASIFTAGFQLSFAAVLGIATMGKRISNKIKLIFPIIPENNTKLGLYRGTIRKILNAFSICFSAWFFTAPVLLFNFQECSLFASLINMLVVPFVYIVIQMGVFSCFAGSIFPFISMIINIIAEKIIEIILIIVGFSYSSFYGIIKGNYISAAIWSIFVVAFVIYFFNWEQREISAKV